MENREIEAMVREVIGKLAEGQERKGTVHQVAYSSGQPVSSTGREAEM